MRAAFAATTGPPNKPKCVMARCHRSLALSRRDAVTGARIVPGLDGDAVEAIADLLSIALLPPVHDPGAGYGVVTAARQRWHLAIRYFGPPLARPGTDKSKPGPTRGATKTLGGVSVPRCRPEADRPGPRPLQAEAESALGGRLAAAVASVASAVSTPPRHSQRPRN